MEKLSSLDEFHDQPNIEVFFIDNPQNSRYRDAGASPDEIHDQGFVTNKWAAVVCSEAWRPLDDGVATNLVDDEVRIALQRGHALSVLNGVSQRLIDRRVIPGLDCVFLSTKSAHELALQ